MEEQDTTCEHAERQPAEIWEEKWEHRCGLDGAGSTYTLGARGWYFSCIGSIGIQKCDLTLSVDLPHVDGYGAKSSYLQMLLTNPVRSAPIYFTGI